jgi:hypothetical protein
MSFVELHIACVSEQDMYVSTCAASRPSVDDALFKSLSKTLCLSSGKASSSSEGKVPPLLVCGVSCPLEDEVLSPSAGKTMSVLVYILLVNGVYIPCIRCHLTSGGDGSGKER